MRLGRPVAPKNIHALEEEEEEDEVEEEEEQQQHQESSGKWKSGVSICDSASRYIQRFAGLPCATILNSDIRTVLENLSARSSS